MIIRPKLTILVIANDEKEMKNCIDHIFASQIPEKTQLIVAHFLENIRVKKYLKEKKQENHKLDVVSCQIKEDYRYPYDIVKYFALRKIYGWKYISKKVKPFRSALFTYEGIAYCEAYSKIRGKYLMYVPQEMQLKKDFWKNTVDILDREKRADTLVASVERKNALLPCDTTPIIEKTSYFEPGEGSIAYLKSTQLHKKIIVTKRRRVNKSWDHYMWADLGSGTYIFEHAVVLRMSLSGGILVHEYVAESEVKEAENRRYESLEEPVLRYAFLKGYNWHYECEHNYKYNTEPMKKAYQEALQEFHQTVREIGVYYTDIGDEDLARRYACYAEAVNETNI